MRKPTPKELFESFAKSTSGVASLRSAKDDARNGHDKVDLAFEVWDDVVTHAEENYDLDDNDLDEYSEEVDEMIQDELER